MSSPVIPDEAREVAAKALLDFRLPLMWDQAWDEIPKSARKELRDAARAALTAAFPFIREQVIAELAAGENPYDSDPHLGMKAVGWTEGRVAGAAWVEDRDRDFTVTGDELDLALGARDEWRAMAERLAACYDAEETEHGFPFSFELRDAHRDPRALLDKEVPVPCPACAELVDARVDPACGHCDGTGRVLRALLDKETNDA